MFFWPIATTKVYCGNTDQLELPAQNIHLWPSGLAEECEGVEEMRLGIRRERKIVG
jgi:hypothetical protein